MGSACVYKTSQKKVPQILIPSKISFCFLPLSVNSLRKISKREVVNLEQGILATFSFLF